MGVLIPSICVESAHNTWQKQSDPVENPNAMFKQVTMHNMSIFCETEDVKSKIDLTLHSQYSLQTN